jgi:hypothetical protein
MKTRLLALFRFVALAFLATASPCSYGGDMDDIAGTWLIDAKLYDFFLNTGVFHGNYPVMVITPDGRFRAYAFGMSCGAYNTVVNRDIGNREILIECKKKIETLQQDLAGATGVLITEGQVERLEDGKLRFTADDQGQSIKKIIGKLRKGDEGTNFKYLLLYYLITQPVDSESLSIVLNTGPENKLQFSFSKYPREILADAMATTINLLVSNTRYFRCVLDTYMRFDNESSPFADELRTLRKLVRESGTIDAISEKFDMYLLMDLAHRNDGDISEADRKEIDRLNKTAWADLEPVNKRLFENQNELEKTPASKAAKIKKFGKYIGCPERDKPNKLLVDIPEEIKFLVDIPPEMLKEMKKQELSQ